MQRISRFIPRRNSILLTLLILFIFILVTNTYLRRYILLNFPDVYDYKHLPRTEIPKSREAFNFHKRPNSELERILPIKYDNQLIHNLDTFLKENFTTAFLVIKNDTILYENYFSGHDRDTYCKSFSISKNIISALVGIAINENWIQSVDDPVIKYIPELKDPDLKKLSIMHCLMGTSGLEFNRGGVFPWHDDARVYYSPDIRDLLTGIHLSKEPGTLYKTDEFSPHLLAWILERATGVKVQDYFREKLWEPLGTEYPAIWVLDNDNDGFVVANSGLISRAVDLAKFGRLYLHDGNWNGTQLVPAMWVQESIRPDTSEKSITTWGNMYYKYLWWGKILGKENSYYEARGHFSQRIHISNSKNMVVVRLGTDSGDVYWSELIAAIVNSYLK